MAYRVGNRQQRQLLPSSVEEFVEADDPVRAYDTFVECLDLQALGFEIDAHRVGRPEFEPASMLKLLVYGYAYGIRSSRKLERATYHNLSFVWLMGGLKPDHKTIARFRRDHSQALATVLRQCAQLCLRLGLVEGNTLFVDGTKIRANASNKHTWSLKRCQEHLASIDQRIRHILQECEQVDASEDQRHERAALPQALRNEQRLRQHVQDVMDELSRSGRTGLNTTDPEAGRQRFGAQVEAGYNCQAVVDDKHGLIVQAEALDVSNDAGQLSRQIQQAHQTLGKPCTTACADAGYGDAADAGILLEQQIEVVVPIIEHSDFREHFQFDTEHNEYQCPEGHRLVYFGEHRQLRHHIYGVRNAAICTQCPRFGQCTKSTQGRRIARPFSEPLRERLKHIYRQPIAKMLMRRRKMRAESPFGHLKHNLGMRAFLLRGRGGVRAELSLGATAFNVRRMIGILGVAKLLEVMAVA